MTTNTDPSQFKQLNKSMTTNKMPTTIGGNSTPGSLLDEPKFYIRELPISMSEDEVSKIFKDVELPRVEINRQHNETGSNTGIVHFTSIENAEKAFAIYGSTVLKVYKSTLSLCLRDPSSDNEPTVNAYILQVKQLQPNTDSFVLFSHFRPYGPLYSVRIIVDKNTGQPRGQGLVQFFNQEDADKAMNRMYGGEVDGKSITITQYHPRSQKPQNIRTNIQSTSGSNGPYSPGSTYGGPQPQSPSPDAPNVDPCNLFIKNLDANISSSDLFNHFRKFGRIISARVMRDQDTGNSKGFGFVSYTSAEEADRARTAMNNKTLGSKQIVVRLHEPKKLRDTKAPHFNGPSSPSESRTTSRRNSDLFPINTVNEYDQETLSGLAPKARKEVLMSELQKRFKFIPSVPPGEVNPIIDHLLSMKLPEILHILRDPAALQAKIHEARNHLKRHNEEPVQLSSSIIPAQPAPTFVQPISEREKFFKAIQKIAPPRNHEEILELIMSLSKKERSMCYFSPDHLNKKIQEANAAVELTHEDDQPTIPPNNISLPPTDVTYSPAPPHVEPYTIMPSLSSIPKSSEQKVISMTNDPQFEEMEKFLDSIKNRPIHEQKQKLGDKLFPRVKASVKSLGLKSQASKVTINLLDTDDLRELAHSMNDPEKFRAKVEAAATKLPQNK